MPDTPPYNPSLPQKPSAHSKSPPDNTVGHTYTAYNSIVGDIFPDRTPSISHSFLASQSAILSITNYTVHF